MRYRDRKSWAAELTDSCIGLDTTATELSVVESVFKLGEGMGPGAINTTNKDTMVESFY